MIKTIATPTPANMAITLAAAIEPAALSALLADSSTASLTAAQLTGTKRIVKNSKKDRMTPTTIVDAILGLSYSITHIILSLLFQLNKKHLIRDVRINQGAAS